MRIVVKEVESKNIWESFLVQSQETPFFQSWLWGEVQKRIGYPVMRLGLFDRGKLAGIAQAIHIKAKRGEYYHVRHGPVFSTFRWSWFDFFWQELKKIGKTHGLAFLRISPILDDTQEIKKEFTKRGFRDSPIHNMDGEVAWVLDLKGKSEDELLAGMRKTTRYLVRKALKIGVKVQTSDDPAAFQAFTRLYRETAQRQHFMPHRGIEEEFQILGQENKLKLFIASYEGEVLAAALIVFYGNQAVFHHSGAKLFNNDIPASYLLQWEAIREAKRLGFARYNFWGVAPPEKNNHPWQGLSLFKMGFGGRLVRHIHSQDFPLSYKYLRPYLIESFFRLRKGY